jgi:hypothetical protein
LAKRSSGCSRRDRRRNLVTILSVVALAILFLWQQSRPPVVVDVPRAEESTAAPAIPTIADASIAVLPFDDLSPAGDQGYFSDGISEEILNVLTRVQGLAVA